MNNLSKNRIEYLDSVRGIAAMMVAIYHFLGLRWEKENSFHYASMIFNGSDAVSFFFVLSGFVLSYKYLHYNQEINLKEYIIKRFLRIYPAYVITVFLNYFYRFRHLETLEFVKDIFYKNDFKLWETIFLTKDEFKIYPPGWTLGVEMALSLLLPFFILAARKTIKYIYLLIPISLYIGAGYLSIFTVHFALGILLAYFYPQIQSYDFKSSKYYHYRYVILFIIFTLFSIRHIDRIHFIGTNLGDVILKFSGIGFFHITGFASFVILLFIINSNNSQKILNKKPLLFLGKISYSIYLMHWLVVVYIIEHWSNLQQLIPNSEVLFVSTFFASILLTIILATFLYHFVEVPFIKIGKSIFQRKTNNFAT